MTDTPPEKKEPELVTPKDPQAPPAVEERVEIRDPRTGQVTSEIKRISSEEGTTEEETTRDVSIPAGGTVTTKRVIWLSEKSAKEFKQKKSVYGRRNFVHFALICLEIILGFRLLLKLTGADPDVGFARFIYGASNFFVAGFNNLFGQQESGNEVKAYFEWSTFVAAIFYWLLAGRLQSFFSLRKPVKPKEVEKAI